jgi:hypothetical protein
MAAQFVSDVERLGSRLFAREHHPLSKGWRWTLTSLAAVGTPRLVFLLRIDRTLLSVLSMACQLIITLSLRNEKQKKHSPVYNKAQLLPLVCIEHQCGVCVRLQLEQTKKRTIFTHAKEEMGN